MIGEFQLLYVDVKVRSAVQYLWQIFLFNTNSTMNRIIIRMEENSSNHTKVWFTVHGKHHFSYLRKEAELTRRIEIRMAKRGFWPADEASKAIWTSALKRGKNLWELWLSAEGAFLQSVCVIWKPISSPFAQHEMAWDCSRIQIWKLKVLFQNWV